MKIAITVFLIAAVIYSGKLYSQVGDISADRPGAGTTTTLMEKNYFQIEAGITSENDEPVKDLKYSTLTAPTLLFRYGMAKNMELRAGIDLLNRKETISGTSTSESGSGPIIVGTKIKLFTEKGSMPETAFLLNISLPYKDNSLFQSTYIGTEFRFAMSNSLSKKVSISYNLGGSFGAGSPGATGIYTFAVGASLMKKLSAFAEIYGFMPQKSSPDHRFDAGISYLILKNVAIDASFGLGISSKSPDYFIAGGVALRLPR